MKPRSSRKPDADFQPQPAGDTQPLFPDPSASIPIVRLKAPVRHPLIYRKRIAHIDPRARPGDWVAVYAPVISQDPAGLGPEEPSEEQLWGYGLVNPRSEIAVRMIRWGAELPDNEFWSNRFSRAVQLRRDLLQLDQVTDAYRLIHAEGDHLPGLVVDRLGAVLSLEFFSWGMQQRSREISRRLCELTGVEHCVIRSAPRMLSQEGFESAPHYSAGAPRSTTIQEYGTRFRVALDSRSHKTGFFCDQRENRFKLAGFCAGKSVLDLCCYTGGFAIQAKTLGKAADVVGVDLDEDPLAIARANAQLNRVQARFVQADVFPYMRDMIRQGRQYDVVVLDPPKLINSRSEIESGTRTHFDLNRLAIQLVKSGGIFLTCSCAGLLTESEFTRVVFAASRRRPDATDAAETQRPPRHTRLLFRSGAAGDHPVASNCPESEYLKALWLTMDDA